MSFVKKHFTNYIILLIFGIGIYFRASVYGDLRLSVANAETHSYMSYARNSIFHGIFLLGNVYLLQT